MNFLAKGLTCATQVRNCLSHILFYDYYYNNKSNQNYDIDPIDDVIGFIDNIDEYLNRLFENEPFFRRLTSANEMKYLFYIDEIKYFLSPSPQKIDRNSIERYCEIKLSHYKKLSSIRNELDRYIVKPEREQLLEEICTFVAIYIQVREDVCYTNVSASLDTIAQEVLNSLRKKHPNHSIFSTSEETFSYWKTNNIKDNRWDETESTLIMDTLQEYIFGTLNFRVCSSVPEDIKCLCIDYVLQSKSGEDIIVYTIFHSVARRIGLRCDAINFFTRLSIFWKPEFVTNNFENARCFYTQKYFPEYRVIDNLSEYMSVRPVAITITKMLKLTRDIVREFIIQHKIKKMRLIRVNCIIQQLPI
ncbi:uncharacterized protein LOC114939335 isoform X1 [Nylanderia fulva]|uniref:uncharacterized protein LOC114939335 isoform X1 n=2 Tax=Nylanderia fulva TaxID=613905 RepID=UPI0010FB8241|nr:uncharacterized protein LOC114939335 isoform X1 [Nylanderia fulva]XP_029169430.1 uncharacterized protein LOC114939335 isoform X1 [Nylanderia fulva]